MNNMLNEHGIIVFSLLIASIFIDKSLAAESLTCADWASFKDEWCYKILDDTFRTFDEAVNSCAKLDNNPTLPIIHTKAEQDFLSNFLFNVTGKIESFWIGAKFLNSINKFQWVDNTELSFINWDPRGARAKANYCVQIQGDETVAGKWIDEPCDKKKNLVVCQKMQTWTLARLQKTLLETRKELKDSEETNLVVKKEFANSLEAAKIKIKILEQNPVPAGFIYVQIPGQPEPKSIWPGVTWTQVTSNYAGQFFRAEGGGSADFGVVQNGDSPKFTSVESEFLANLETRVGSFSVTPGQWSGFVRSGGPGGDEHHGVKFLLSNPEIRPLNQAVRIWKREK